MHLELVFLQVGMCTPRRGTELNARVGSNDVQLWPRERRACVKDVS